MRMVQLTKLLSPHHYRIKSTLSLSNSEDLVYITDCRTLSNSNNLCDVCALSSSPGDAFFPDYDLHLLGPIRVITLTRVAPIWVFASNLLAPVLTARKAYSILTPAAQTITTRDNLSCNTAISRIPATMDHTPAMITNNFGPKVRRILLEKL